MGQVEFLQVEVVKVLDAGDRVLSQGKRDKALVDGDALNF